MGVSLPDGHPQQLVGTWRISGGPDGYTYLYLHADGSSRQEIVDAVLPDNAVLGRWEVKNGHLVVEPYLMIWSSSSQDGRTREFTYETTNSLKCPVGKTIWGGAYLADAPDDEYSWEQVQ